MAKYYPKKPIRSFQDLQVYQLSYNLMIKITKVQNLSRNCGSEPSNLIKTISKVPELIATAHSLRFGDSGQAISILEEAMLACNLAVHYLSLVRDLTSVKGDTLTGDARESRVGTAKPEDLTFLDATTVQKYQKQYLQIRTKILRLQMSWKKFAKNYDQK